MTKDRRLGKGLAALLGSSTESNETTAPPATDKAPSPAHANAFTEVAIADIDDSPYQPRRQFDPAQIEALSQSLKQHDLLQPIVIRPVGSRYQLISGERRLRAATLAGWKTMPAQIRHATDREAAELAIIENLQRQDLNALEKAHSFKRYLDDHACTHGELAKRLSVDRSTVANLIRLLELPDQIKESLAHDLITAGHARALLPLTTASDQIKLCERIVRDSMSVRAVEQYVQDALFTDDSDSGNSARPTKRKPGTSHPHQITRLEQELKQALGTRVHIREQTGGKGKIVIHFKNHDEFQRLLMQFTNRTNTLRRAG
ncbi:MAG: ParB/RepB/Spo0J family partition protein [Planctomycetota bacterium]|nr:ParB/RepB/Spo0J family partition protein [Planctomycetota bacterium]